MIPSIEIATLSKAFCMLLSMLPYNNPSHTLQDFEICEEANALQ